MMRLLLLTACLLLLTVFDALAQTIDKYVVSNGGERIENINVVVNFTIGEPAIGLIYDTSSVDQGFWSGSLSVEMISEDKGAEDIMVYPNPVENQLTIVSNEKKIFGIAIFSISGQQVVQKKIDIEKVEHLIDFSHLTRGTYILRLFLEEEDKAKLFKVVKK